MLTNPPPTGADTQTKPGPSTKKTATKPARPKGKPLTPAERQGIVDSYAAGASIRSIWLEHGFAKPTIHRVIKAGGGHLRNDATPAKFSDSQLRAWHRYGWTVQEIADKTGAHHRTIHRRLAKVGLQAHVPEQPNLPAVEIMAAYAGGMSLRALGAQHDAHQSTIRRLIVKNGGTIRTNNAPPRISTEQLADYCVRGLTVKQISDETGATVETVRVHLHNNGLRATSQRRGRAAG